ncbi:MAG: hypothetical protein ABSH32_33000 [Bryobacteraceae bacterium]
MSRTGPVAAYRSEPVNSHTEQLDLNRLRKRLREKPRTKAGQVRQAWPDIRDLLAAGHTLKDVRIWLNEIGLEIEYTRLSHYVGQLRRKDEVAQSQIRVLKPGLHETGAEVVTESDPERQNGMAQVAQPMADDGGRRNPLANVLERQSKRPGFNYNAEPDPKKLI